MQLYFDSAYLAKVYLNEPDGKAVRRLCGEAESRYTSELAIAELATVFHRQVRERRFSWKQAESYRDRFVDDVEQGYWILLQIDGDVLSFVQSQLRMVPPSVYIRAGDAIHLATAALGGFKEIWSNDRHLMAAAPHFGIAGRSVQQFAVDPRSNDPRM